MALRMVSSLRATAMIATIFGFPAATRRSKKALRTGLCCLATIAPMNRAVRTTVRPPPIKLLPRHFPDWRGEGARTAGGAGLSRAGGPRAGRLGGSVRALARPAPGDGAGETP